MGTSHQYDFFISHASEDKDDFARALVESLESRGYRVWYDENTLRVGDSLRASIDDGLRSSAHGVVLVSPAFLKKTWPQRELGALISSDTRILPVWHNVSAAEVKRFSPLLADRVAASTAEGVEAVAEKLVQAARRELPARSRMDGPPLTTGPTFATRFDGLPNALPYAMLVGGAAPESPNPLSDQALDLFEDWAKALEPTAECHFATPQLAWWRISSASAAGDQWQAWLLPGPVVSVIMGMPAIEDHGADILSFPLLVAWWAEALNRISSLLADLGVEYAGFGFGLNTCPIGLSAIQDLAFDEAPTPYKGGARVGVAPWTFKSEIQRCENAYDHILLLAADSLLRHFSYRRLEPVLDWVRRGIADGSLARRSPSASRMSEEARAASEAEESLEKRRALAQRLLRLSGHEEDANRI